MRDDDGCGCMMWMWMDGVDVDDVDGLKDVKLMVMDDVGGCCVVRVKEIFEVSGFKCVVIV